MAPRKTATKTATLDPVKVCSLALKQVKSASDYHQIGVANSPETLTAAWEYLAQEDQTRIINIVNNDTPADPKTIASELMACGTLIQLQAIKVSYGDIAVKTAWKLLPQDERDRIKSLCDNGQKEEVQPVTEQSESAGAYTQDLTEQWSQQQEQLQPQHKRTLFGISEDLQQLNDLLDKVGDDSQQQELINQWFETLGEERDRKLDGYAALISEMQARADVRKAEAKRMQDLAAVDEYRARLLKERLKHFFQLHDLKTVDTARYRLSLAKNGGKQPLILDDSIPVTQLPEQFQKVSIDADTAKIREALEAGESLPFAHLAERGTSLRIK